MEWVRIGQVYGSEFQIPPAEGNIWFHDWSVTVPTRCRVERIVSQAAFTVHQRTQQEDNQPGRGLGWSFGIWREPADNWTGGWPEAEPAHEEVGACLATVSSWWRGGIQNYVLAGENYQQPEWVHRPNLEQLSEWHGATSLVNIRRSDGQKGANYGTQTYRCSLAVFGPAFNYADVGIAGTQAPRLMLSHQLKVLYDRPEM